MEPLSVIIFGVILLVIYFLWGRPNGQSTKPGNQGNLFDQTKLKNNSIYRMYMGGTHSGKIIDKFTSLDEVTEAVRKAGLESSNLIFGIDFTASNVHQGLKTYGGRSLHHLDILNPNPYQRVISILGETLESFDEDNLIPAFGFGDVTTKDFGTFPFLSEGYCAGFQSVLSAYNGVAERVRLSGPTNFAPLINKAVDIVKNTRAYHILVIVADGQVTSEKATKQAIVQASYHPLSIILVGVGDGPWDMMEEFDDGLPSRKFDNFQFVDFNKIISEARNPEAAFALCALMEIPDQYKKIKQLGLLNFD
ncbi:uncharacterized protein LOC123527573 isoform X1 [Mercenaria mercenaria]|uniref:uncharacterized protein LOC123527573 isoform X1 n=1 Tax=Mercenaria mercenaria TaxID=6596 RepID=UPI00234F156F|nr:uncharacterized protein LOC123527573 isoform X1 [Mercenaria mercenaria]